MLILEIAVVIWLILSVITFFFYMKKQDNFKLWEKIMLSLSWFSILPLLLIHKIHMKINNN